MAFLASKSVSEPNGNGMRNHHRRLEKNLCRNLNKCRKISAQKQKMKGDLTSLQGVGAMAKSIGHRLRNHRVEQFIAALFPFIVEFVGQLQLLRSFFRFFVQIFQSGNNILFDWITALSSFIEMHIAG